MAIVIASPRAESWGVAGVVRPGFGVSFILEHIHRQQAGIREKLAEVRVRVARRMSAYRGSNGRKPFDEVWREAAYDQPAQPLPANSQDEHQQAQNQQRRGQPDNRLWD